MSSILDALNKLESEKAQAHEPEEIEVDDVTAEMELVGAPKAAVPSSGVNVSPKTLLIAAVGVVSCVAVITVVAVIFVLHAMGVSGPAAANGPSGGQQSELANMGAGAVSPTMNQTLPAIVSDETTITKDNSSALETPNDPEPERLVVASVGATPAPATERAVNTVVEPIRVAPPEPETPVVEVVTPQLIEKAEEAAAEPREPVAVVSQPKPVPVVETPKPEQTIPEKQIVVARNMGSGAEQGYSPTPEKEVFSPPVRPPVPRSISTAGQTAAIPAPPVSKPSTAKKEAALPLDLYSLPVLNSTVREQNGISTLKVNMPMPATKTRPLASAIINMKQVFVGDRIPGTSVKLIAVEIRGIGVQVTSTGDRYYVPL